MFKKLFLAFGILFSLNATAQNFQGKAIYQSKSSFKFDFGDRKVPEEAKKKMQARIDKAGNKTFELHFNKTAAIYQEHEKLEDEKSGGRGAIFASVFGGPSIGKSYKNVATKESKRAIEFFGKDFLVTDTIKAFQWKMEGETKKIGNYTCFKATTLVDKKQNAFAKSTDSTATKTKVTVWYTMQIPVSLGPDKYWGLPGLILSVNAGDLQIVCTQIVLNSKEKFEIKAPKKGKEVSEEEFEIIVAEKTSEIKERFKNGKGRGRR